MWISFWTSSCSLKPNSYHQAFVKVVLFKPPTLPRHSYPHAPPNPRSGDETPLFYPICAVNALCLFQSKCCSSPNIYLCYGNNALFFLWLRIKTLMKFSPFLSLWLLMLCLLLVWFYYFFVLIIPSSSCPYVG